ncbi:MAG: hypothetical protein E7643_06470 [Ruminococcaceae bacterium]|nr:hypothetical protein [Oscillospiraceae bacterium]
MRSAFTDILNGKESNYLLPFYWQHGDHREKIPSQIEAIAQSGAKAFCVEARPHNDFAGEGWWEDLELILSEATKRGMKVWLLDDDHFPTGHANGMIEKKYPHLAPVNLIERHIDVVGPMKEASLLLPADCREDALLGVFAYSRHADDEEICENEPIDLSARVDNDTLDWDIPEGLWRVFYYYRSRKGAKHDYIDMLNPASVDVLIEAVYEPHWEHFSHYFGNTFVGFFSDEPGFKNQYQFAHRHDDGPYEMTVGRVGLALPWNDEVRSRMHGELGFDPLPHLNLLWYEGADGGELRAALRVAYMNAVTKMYELYFCRRLGDWCHAHGVEYIGHVIEDNGCHARLFYGAGHYFRSLNGQDMAGMDIVLHQVMPGFSDTTHTAYVSTGVAKGPFFHYALAKLCASHAHLNPPMKGRAMCEVFGAFGWAEGTPFMKWLIDFLLVRGVNHFVPHAFSPTYPDHDCPPHFGAEGHDPCFEGFSALMKYTNRAAHLLCGGRHVANAAILYHAESEWASKLGEYMPVEIPARALYDAHIDYDIVPMDYLREARVKDGKLCLADERFDCLIVPAASHLPVSHYPVLEKLQKDGLPIRFVDTLPANASPAFEAVPLSVLADFMKQNGFYDVSVPSGYSKLRVFHTQKDGQDIFMLFNEDYARTADTVITLPVSGSYVEADLLCKIYHSAYTDTGKVEISLCPGESKILIFGEAQELPAKKGLSSIELLHPHFSLSLADARTPWKYVDEGEYDAFFNVTAKNRHPDFAGKMKYTFTFRADKTGSASLDLGDVGEVAELTLNGHDMGIRICRPYVFDISDVLKTGINEATVTVSNSLVRHEKDSFSTYMQIPPSGILGDVTLKYYE